jgi:hypothetical protein
VKIRTVYMRAYLPGVEEFFTMNGLDYANIYSERNMPPVPVKLGRQDRENVQRVLHHFHHLFPDKREAEIAISWFAYVVQERKRPNWAIMMQGAEGDGRSFFGSMMAAVLGGDNVRTVNAKTLEDKFNGWAEGQLFTLIEEVRMIGHNRHDVINSIKPLITNDTIDIRAMHMNSYNVPNTTAYMLTTNFQNALPLNDTDRRYFVLMSQWQDAKSIEDLGTEYFDELFATLRESAGAIRGWLLKYKLHPEFKPQGRAPNSRGKAQMIDLNKSDEVVQTEDLIDGGFFHDISNDVVLVSKLAEVLSKKNSPYTVKEASCAAILRQLGFTYLGRVMIDGKRDRIWSKTPKRFMNGTVAATVQIAKYLKNPL